MLIIAQNSFHIMKPLFIVKFDKFTKDKSVIITAFEDFI